MDDKYAVFIKDVTKIYGKQAVLKKMCMSVERGTIYGLLGASGCGKTTLLKSVVGTTKVEKGEIRVLGGRPGDGKYAFPGPKVGYMPQDTALCGEFTVRDAVFYFGRIFRMTDDLILERYNNLHQMLELPPHDRYLRNCSGGEQRRVSLAATLIHKPELLIMDEPTVGLDPVMREKIWNHLYEITRSEKTSVIITTHYVEECRNVDTVGFMRKGRLLAEESPKLLLDTYRAETLEQVFLILAQNDVNLKRSSISVLENNAQNTIQVEQRRTNCGTWKRRFTVDKRRFRALIDKNWKQFYRNITGIFFLLSFPVMEIGAFLSSVGGDVRNIPVGIINNEIRDCSNFTSNGTAIPYDYFYCHFHNMSCRFLSYVDDPMIQKMYYPTLEDAMLGVKNGEIAGIIHLSQNFTYFFEKRFEDLRNENSEILDLSQIKIWLDMSNYQIGSSLKYKLVQKYNDFQDAVLTECGFDLKLYHEPLRIDNFYVGSNKHEPFIIFMLPGILITIQFFLGAVMTSQIIITDRHDGVWDRSIVAGVTSMEITLSHFILQLALCVIQTIELMFCTFVLYQLEYIGSLSLMFLLVFSQGVCGMAYGFFVSVISTDHTMANVVLTGLYLPVNLLSGWMWPVEGMVYGLRVLARCLPLTVAIESFRNIFKKGWDLSYIQVLDGFLIGIVWTIFFGLLSVYLISKKR
ncbi:unnamed protein product [Psylliodes chrysocephalus]|uniref:Uncharacterized protein n=1 Tax=Psylliodes chrysocephalus TaxID=3402493 RepID=A0A9P0CQ80_9CUCU|nr:unnamed protein product [Psylliodes chrysocephala]